MEEANNSLDAAGKDWAVAEDLHRRARANAYLQVTTGKNRESREAIADPFFADERLRAFLAEATKEACLERVRSLRTQLSALQTIIAARRSELEAHAYNQVGR